jgi:hypothetical protein
MKVIDINFLNLKTKHRILGFEASVSRNTLRYSFLLSHYFIYIIFIIMKLLLLLYDQMIIITMYVYTAKLI